MTRVLVTGATGFVGRVLCATLSRRGYRVRAALRTSHAPWPEVAETVVVGDIAAATAGPSARAPDWMPALEGVGAVIHLAARAHLPRNEPEPAERYHAVNALGTQALLQSAVTAGTRQFVYLSSIKVNGEGVADKAYTSADTPHPTDAYGLSKWEGERFVTQCAADSGLTRVIVRAPLVYGPAVRANFLRLLRWVDRGWPIPLGAVRNARSMINVWNLADLLVHSLDLGPAASGVWMASDGVDLSTAELVRRIGATMGRRVRLPAVPAGMLRLCAAMAGRTPEFTRLCGSLTVDISDTRRALGWSPPMSVADGLERTVRWYLAEGRPRSDRPRSGRTHGS